MKRRCTDCFAHRSKNFCELGYKQELKTEGTGGQFKRYHVPAEKCNHPKTLKEWMFRWLTMKQSSNQAIK